MTYVNRAAWQVGKKVLALKVDDAPYTPPGKDQVVIRNGAVAINPFDWWMQYVGAMFAPHLTYPTILGTDCAGTIVEVGSDVTRFKVGDRVTGHAAVIGKESGKHAEGAFQLYPVLREYLICKTPATVTDEEAAVLGLAFATAGFALFSKDYCALDAPTVPPPANPRPGAAHRRCVIITGGASSLGSCGIQLARGAGYDVISTCSPHNFDYVRGLGAAHVLDYHSATLVPDLAAATAGYELAACMTVGQGAHDTCAAVIKERLARWPDLPTRKFVALAGGSRREPETLAGALVIPGLIANMSVLFTRLALRKMFTGVEIKFVMIKDQLNPESTVSRLYQDYMSEALATGQFMCAPRAEVVGRGLNAIQDGIEAQKKGVSAAKIVVSLP